MPTHPSGFRALVSSAGQLPEGVCVCGGGGGYFFPCTGVQYLVYDWSKRAQNGPERSDPPNRSGFTFQRSHIDPLWAHVNSVAVPGSKTREETGLKTVKKGRNGVKTAGNRPERAHLVLPTGQGPIFRKVIPVSLWAHLSPSFARNPLYPSSGSQALVPLVPLPYRSYRATGL